MKILNIAILAAFFGLSLSANAANPATVDAPAKPAVVKKRHCVTHTNANNERVTTCDGKIVRKHGAGKKTVIEKHRTCTTEMVNGKKVKKCKTVRTHK